MADFPLTRDFFSDAAYPANFLFFSVFYFFEFLIFLNFNFLFFKKISIF